MRQAVQAWDWPAYAYEVLPVTTLAQLGTIVSDMTMRSDLHSLGYIATETRAAVRHYQSERFWFNESRISLSCSSTITKYTLSATTSIVQVIAVQAIYGGTSYVVTPISETERLQYDSNNTTGSPPTWYSIFGGLFIPYPAPAGVYTIEVAAVMEPATLSSSNDTNVFLQNAVDLIANRVAANVAIKYAHNDDMGQRFKLLERESLNELRMRVLRITPRRIIPTDF